MRSGACRTLHPPAIPFLDGLQGPVRGPCGVAAVARVRNAVLFGQQRIRNDETMIPARVPLHIDRLRHVTIHTASARLIDGVKTVRRWIDLRCRACRWRAMAAQAKIVAGHQQLLLVEEVIDPEEEEHVGDHQRHRRDRADVDNAPEGPAAGTIR